MTTRMSMSMSMSMSMKISGRTGRTGGTGRKGMHVCMFVLVYFKSFPVYLYVYNSVCEILCMHVRVLILCTGKRLRIYA